MRFILAVISMIGLSGQCDASPLERARRDDIVFMADDHPYMVAAMQKAKSSLSEFLALARNPQSSMSHFAVKVGIKDGSKVEYFWIIPFREANDRFSGPIDNTPRHVTNVTADQVIEFGKNEIVDWMYIDGSKMKGNFTACALLKREPKRQADAFRRKFGLDCAD